MSLKAKIRGIIDNNEIALKYSNATGSVSDFVTNAILQAVKEAMPSPYDDENSSAGVGGREEIVRQRGYNSYRTEFLKRLEEE